MSAHLGEDYVPLKKMIDLNKAGAWSDVEQLEIAELLRNPTYEMVSRAVPIVMGICDVEFEDAHLLERLLGVAITDIFKAMIDAATGGEG